MAKNLETGKFEQVTGSTDTYFDGKYVDYVYSKEEEEEITSGTGTHFFDATIIPTVQYQVYGLDNVWFWDNEGQNYTFDETTKSTITVKSSNLILQAYSGDEGDSPITVTEELTAGSPAPSNAVEGSIIKDSSENLFEAVPAASYESPYEFNKYGKVNNTVVVEITPASALVSKYPNAIVTINGKEHDLGYLAAITKTVNDGTTTYTVGDPKPITLVMDKDYRISINWVWGSIVETFRIICNR